MEQRIPVDTGAEAFLELLNANGVDYIFLNPGTDTYTVQEAVSKFKTLGKRTPEVILSLHESVAMAAAHGYFMVSGKPQVVLVHADLGPQQVGGALHNAQRGRAGVLLCSGRVPSSIDKDRYNQVHWLQEQFDQAGVVRGYVKWDYELRSSENMHHVVQRAFQMASGEPCGPVYLCLSPDVLGEKISSVFIPDVARYAAASTPQADTALLAEVAVMMTGARNPLIITGYSGRHPQSVAPLVELAESVSARVISAPPRMNFPSTHPLFSGFDANPYIAAADFILIIDQDIPYIPSIARPGPGARIVHIDIDPVKEKIPLWGFPVDILLQADTGKAFPVLRQMVHQQVTPEYQDQIQSRFHQLQSEHRKMKEEWHRMAVTGAGQKPIPPEWLCYCINEIIDEETIVLGEALTNMGSVLRQINRTRPGTYFQSGGSNLGWGLGAALGARLASPDKTVVSIVGDGSFIFGCPTAALWMAHTYHAPFLCIILNNMRYNAPRTALRKASGGTSFSEKTGLWIGTDIKPPPDYAAIARACFAWGQTVDEPSDLLPALKTAFDQVRRGKTAVLDVRIDCP